MEETISTFEEVFVQSAIALQEAVATHGPDAVELGLMVYRLNGIRTVAAGLFAATIIVAAILAYVKIAARVEAGLAQHAEGSAWIVGAMITAIVCFFAMFKAPNILDLYAWAAALGHPEVLIAAKALMAAGLL